MPGSFVDQRERSNEELKTKGRIESERQWGSKVKGSSAMQNIFKGMASLWKGYVNLCLQMGRDKFSLHEQNEGTLVYCQVEGQGPGKPLSMSIITKASQRNSFQYGLRIDFLPATLSQSLPLSCGKKGCWSFCLVRWIFLGVSAVFASVSNIEICLLFVPLLECLISHL